MFVKLEKKEDERINQSHPKEFKICRLECAEM